MDGRDRMDEKAWLDVSVFRCPRCGRRYADVSWYAIELESDIECGSCHETFNIKKNLTDRILLAFDVDGEGKVREAKVVERIQR